jgi:hypothetical protein
MALKYESGHNRIWISLQKSKPASKWLQSMNQAITEFEYICKFDANFQMALKYELGHDRKWITLRIPGKLPNGFQV